MRITKERIIFIAIIAFSLILRLYNLSKESLWLDETTTAQRAQNSITEIIKMFINYDEHSPLYYFIINIWSQFFGTSEFALRLPSVIFSILTIIMLYKVTSFLFEKKVGLISSFIISLSSFHIYYAQEARVYSLFTFLTLLSIYYFLLSINKKDNITIKIVYVLSSIALLYSHYYSFFIILSQNIYFFTAPLLFRKTYLNLKKWLIMQIIIFFFFLPFLLIMIKHRDIFDIIHQKIIFSNPFKSLFKILVTFSGSAILFYIFLILSFFSIFAKHKKIIIDKENLSKLYFLFIWFFIPFFIPFLIAFFTQAPSLMNRYLLPSSLAFYIVIAKGLNFIFFRYLKAFLIFSLIILSSLNIFTYYNSVKKYQWRELSQYLSSYAKREDLLLIRYKFLYKPLNYYFYQNGLHTKVIPIKSNKISEIDTVALNKVINKYNKIWIIISHDNNYQSKYNIEKTLSNNYSITYLNQFKNIQLLLLEKLEIKKQ